MIHLLWMNFDHNLILSFFLYVSSANDEVLFVVWIVLCFHLI